jgi:hypothetical protein
MAVMSDDKIKRRSSWVAAAWFAMALSGILFFAIYAGPAPKDWLPIAMFFPTTTVGIGGGIGALYGRTMRGILIALIAECMFTYFGLMLAFSGFEDFRGILFAAAATATCIWLMFRVSANWPLRP